MTEAEIKALVLELICELAPEADTGSASDRDDIREVFDLDSMDFSNLVVALHKRTGIDIPEADYNRLFTLGNAVAYLRHALEQAAPGA